MNSTVRTGFVSSVNYDTGAVRVIYPDRDGEVTAPFPYFTFHGEYQMPEINTQVLVLHLSNDSSSGIVLGKFWDESPPIKGPGRYYKPFSKLAYMQMEGNELVFHTEQIKFECAEGSITVSDLMQMKHKLESLE